MISKNKFYSIISKLVSLKEDFDMLGDSEFIMQDDYEDLFEFINSCIDILVSYMPHIK